MQAAPAVRAILGSHGSDNPGSTANLVRILMQGKLGGTGGIAFLSVNQGFKRGPARSLARWRCWPGSSAFTGSKT